eukprot:gb/GEZN01009938.1/.p1 GENE.gb/GEZN01009938.1/~~gb/GEZN01009938.1/.p1  ORF type:complete len:384 (+),score=40.98 gb/GEZN01009938.1/:113-1264(+)
MLQDIILTTTSGLLLFSKSFLKGKLPTQLAGLVTAMVEFSTRRAGLPVSYIELSNTAVAITTDPVAKVTCAVFHHSEDGPSVGGLLAQELLQAFVESYSRRFPIEAKMAVEEGFREFGYKITEVIKNAVGPVLNKLRARKEVQQCLLIIGDSLQYATDPVDKLGLLANHEALTAASHELLLRKQDAAAQCYLVSRDSTTMVHRYAAHRASLIVKYRSRFPQRRKRSLDSSHQSHSSSNLQTETSAIHRASAGVDAPSDDRGSSGSTGTATRRSVSDKKETKPTHRAQPKDSLSTINDSSIRPQNSTGGGSVLFDDDPVPGGQGNHRRDTQNVELTARATAAAVRTARPDLHTEIQNTARLIETLLVMVSNLQLQETAQLLDIR